MFTEDDFIHINALQHYMFCRRQCALVYVEDVWQENVLTIRGSILHEKIDSENYETRRGVKSVFNLRIHSYRLGIVGKCDVVEFRKGASATLVTPVEFKAGKPKCDNTDKVQLCAQVLCLEEMLSTTIPEAEFFYGKIRRRVPVEMDSSLREQTENVVQGVRELLSKQIVPKMEYHSHCRSCSLEQICMPKVLNDKKIKNYLHQLYTQEL